MISNVCIANRRFAGIHCIASTAASGSRRAQVATRRSASTAIGASGSHATAKMNGKLLRQRNRSIR